MKQPCVYILASKRNGTLYTGVTSDLVQRVWQHKNGVVEGFTKRYGVHLLVWFEIHETMASAIAREKAIKEWKRAWKIELIEKSNPTWRDLYGEIVYAGFRRHDEARAGPFHTPNGQKFTHSIS
jgi:putative endonuclease